MKIIFCADPVTSSEPDSQFTDEVAAATHAGLTFHRVDYEALTQENNPARAVRDVPAYTTIESALYRGWELTARQYERLYDALLSRGLRLITAPEAYRQVHHLPEFLPIIEDVTPRTVWVHSDGHHVDENVMMHLLEKFAGQPIILRDFVQTLKHYWLEACYIGSASNASMVSQTIQRFLAIRGDRLVGGLVFREYVDFVTLSDETRGGKPIINEYRLLWLNGEPIAILSYWDEAVYQGTPPDAGTFRDVVMQIDNPFFAMDVALRPDGRWQILELDDAQIVTLPQATHYETLYRAIATLGGDNTPK